MTEDNQTHNYKLDYEKTTATFQQYNDIRFKLLAFVPTLSGLGVALLTGKDISQETALGVGFLGLLVTTGIIIYELRNTQLYDAAIHRAQWLEHNLNFQRQIPCKEDGTSNDEKLLNKSGGLFVERPVNTLPIIKYIKHDVGLALIYSASLFGWVYIFASAITLKSSIPSIWSFVLAFYYSLICFILFRVLDKDERQPQPHPRYTKEEPSQNKHDC